MFQKIRQYFTEVRSELKQTTWPSKDATKRMTLLVLVVAALIALYLGGIDFLLQKLMETLI